MGPEMVEMVKSDFCCKQIWYDWSGFEREELEVQDLTLKIIEQKKVSNRLNKILNFKRKELSLDALENKVGDFEIPKFV